VSDHVPKWDPDDALTAVERELARQEWQERFAKRPETRLGVSAAELLEQERRGRDEQLWGRAPQS
jgi:hypothetical protein